MEIYSVPPFSTPLTPYDIPACHGRPFFCVFRLEHYVVECYSLLTAVGNPVRKNQARKVEH